MNKRLALASIVAALATAVHFFAGSNDVATPRLASGLPDEVPLTLYAAWHMVSALLGSSAVVLARAARPRYRSRMRAAVRLVAFLWLASSAVFLVVAATQPGEGLFLELPQWILLLPVGLLAWWGADRLPPPEVTRGDAA